MRDLVGGPRDLCSGMPEPAEADAATPVNANLAKISGPLWQVGSLRALRHNLSSPNHILSIGGEACIGLQNSRNSRVRTTEVVPDVERPKSPS